MGRPIASRTFTDVQLSLLKRKVDLYAAVSVGAAGAVTLQKWNYPVFSAGPNARTYTAAATASGSTGWPNTASAGSEGIRSVTRTGTGTWTLVLQDNYQRLLALGVLVRNATGTPTTGGIGENSAVSSMGASGGSIIGLVLTDFAGAAADPASGDLVLLNFTLQDATEP